MSRRDMGKKESGGGGSPGWMTTFSDLMSLLLTFFILLYSMSSVDDEKFQNVSNSLKGALAGTGGTSIIDGIDPPPTIVQPDEEDYNEDELDQGIVEMHDKVKDYIDDEEMGKEISVNMNKRGVFVDIKEAILFDPGSADIKDGGLQVLAKLEDLLNDFDNDIVIEGYTDNVPMNNEKYASNWELSTARAVSVVRHLSEKQHINPNRLSAVGFGEFSPIVPNDTPENRATNRRVNILIIFDEESDG